MTDAGGDKETHDDRPQRDRRLERELAARHAAQPRKLRQRRYEFAEPERHADAKHDADDAAERRKRSGLDEELQHDVTTRRAQRAADADLARAFRHRS